MSQAGRFALLMQCAEPISNMEYIALLLQAVERLSHFAAKSALAITGLGRSSVEELYTDGVISTPGDIFRLKKKKDLLEGRPGWGKQSTAKLLEAIEGENKPPGLPSADGPDCFILFSASRSVPMERLLIGLGVPGLGDKSARLLASEFHGDMGELWQSLLSASRTEGKTEAEAEGGPRAALEERLLRIEGFGPLTVQSLFSFASEKDTQRMVDDLLSEVYVTGVGSKVVATTEDTMGALEGLRVVITGRLTDMTRSEAEALVKSQGGIASSTITKNTNLVVCGADPGPSKLEKCQKLGLRVVDEAHFRNLCDSSSHKF
jgi:DNA ligase (NAD+)